MTLKRRVNIRLINIPPMKEISIGSIRNVRQCHVNKYMVLYGTVVRAQTCKNRETKKDFACKTCGKIYTAASDIYEFSSFKLPPICGGQVEKRPNPFQIYINNMKKRRGQGED
jgi:DNA replicative helicase MCM subunit Mcm2 (Cdc46/Mcm family)